MIEVSAAVLLIKLADILLSRVSERSVTNIVSESDRFYKIEIKVKSRANSTRNSRNKLNVKRSSRYIIVLVERENLCLVCVSIILGAMKYLINVARVGGAPDRLTV